MVHDFSPNCIRSKLLIHQVHSRYNIEVCHGRGNKDTMGDVLIRRLWERQTDAIIDVIFGDAN